MKQPCLHFLRVMNKKDMRIVLLLVLVSLSACSKSLIEDSNVVNQNLDSITFLLQEIDYTTNDEQPIVPVNLFQDVDYGYQVQLVGDDDRYLWYLYSMDPLPQDSVHVIVSINYKLEGIDLQFSDLLIEFVYREHLDNLDLQADGTYKFTDLGILYNQLMTQDWGETGYGINKSQMQLTVKEKIELENYSYYVSTNGLYFDDETVELTAISYDAENQSIYLRGVIEAYVKELSCGFYNTHHITKGQFSGVIQ